MSPALACFDLDLLEARVSEKRGDVARSPAPVAMNANDRIADRDAAADDAPEGDPAEVIAVMQVGDEHLEKRLGSRRSAAAHASRSPRRSGVMSSLFSCSSRMAKPFLALA